MASSRRKQQEPPREKMYTLDEMTMLLNVERHELVEWIQFRRIPYILINGTQIRFRMSDVVQWFRERRDHEEKHKEVQRIKT